MDRISELRRRERKLRDKVCQAPVGEFGATPSDQSWVVHHLSEMRMIFSMTKMEPK